MNIYTNPYVYKLVHRITGQFYIGYRCANKVPAEQDIGHHYFSSSKLVKEIGFEHFDWVIIAEFFRATDAREFEFALITEFFDDPLILNKHAGGKKFHCSGHSDETRSKLSAIFKGKPRLAETNAKLSATNRGVPKPPFSDAHKGALSAAAKKRVRKPHTDEARAKISVANKNRVYKPTGPRSPETKAKISAANKGRSCKPFTDERRAACSEALRRRWATRKDVGELRL